MSDHCVHSHRTYYLLHFNYRAASRTVTFEMGPSIQVFVCMDREKQTLEYWKNKVSGSKEEIECALKVLGSPKDANELQREITKQMREELAKVLQQADEQRKYSPY